MPYPFSSEERTGLGGAIPGWNIISLGSGEEQVTLY